MEITKPLPSLISRLYQDHKDIGASLASSQPDTVDNNSQPAIQPSSRELNLTMRSQKLSAISKEFFNGPIASNNMAALSQSLYENGFLSSTELHALDNTQTEQSTITQSKHFINSFMFEASKQGDSQTLSMLEPIAQAIDNMDAVASNRQRQTEVIALDNANQILAHLKDLNSDEALIKEFENVVDVLSTLDTLRQNDQAKQGVAEYEAIQSDYASLFDSKEDA
ncbi:MAG: hemoglobin-like flavoprotein [Oceanicoccus sp.]|jgi:hemoglobin-like flavoprotein